MSHLVITPQASQLQIMCRSFHTSGCSRGLMEFFDDKEVWAESTVNTGRPYRLDELRIKSNQDLHKLWYVLLKERNMLLTMEAEYERRCEVFPSPERTTKVEESMENILEVVAERDEAVNLLETGQLPHPKGGIVRDFLGRPMYRRFQEYAIPPHMNKVYRLLWPLGGLKRQHLKYLPQWREKIARRRWFEYHRQLKLNRELVRRFPHLQGRLEEVEKPEEPKVS
ncbi:39S ribosomal protein L47, mitochondrial [Elysia marginata]|uniref:Large ribosomal subunit protein uL29m n=1 Tax=Elysia marginata TaxID=1093978 RepID=A0AAV4I749_9GAST|nr:39S ribosomal protein L47, mitochondrial [Elysia marginata]